MSDLSGSSPPAFTGHGFVPFTFGSSSGGASSSTTTLNNSSGFSFKDVTRLKDTIKDLERQISYLRGYFLLFKQQMPTDIQLKPNDGPCIPAHRAILEERSKIYKSMLDSNGIKAPPSDDVVTVTLSELNTEELCSLLEFVYTGNLPEDKLEKHAYSLYVAAHKYETPNLPELCERYLLNHMNTSNAVKILALLDARSNKTMKETSLNFIVENLKDIVSSKEYADLARAKPLLSVQITRAFNTKASIDAEGFRAKMRDMRPMTSNQPPSFGRLQSKGAFGSYTPTC